jgi:aspartate/methionine/tyrosine aminotransferase
VTLWHLLEPGDRAVVLVPTYGQTPGLAEGLGAQVATFALEESLSWQPSPGCAEATITPDTRLVVVTNPSNPTGSTLSAEAIDEILRACERSGAWLLVDEVYVGAEAEGTETPSFWGRYERTLVTGSLSKAYGLPGLRLGWLLGPAQEMEALWARKDYTTISPPAASDALATRVLRPEIRRRVLSRTRDILVRNRAIVDEWLTSRPSSRSIFGANGAFSSSPEITSDWTASSASASEEKRQSSWKGLPASARPWRPNFTPTSIIVPRSSTRRWSCWTGMPATSFRSPAAPIWCPI